MSKKRNVCPMLLLNLITGLAVIACLPSYGVADDFIASPQGSQERYLEALNGSSQMQFCENTQRILTLAQQLSWKIPVEEELYFSALRSCDAQHQMACWKLAHYLRLERQRVYPLWLELSENLEVHYRTYNQFLTTINFPEEIYEIPAGDYKPQMADGNIFFRSRIQLFKDTSAYQDNMKKLKIYLESNKKILKGSLRSSNQEFQFLMEDLTSAAEHYCL